MEVAITYDTLSRWGGQELITYAMTKALSEGGFTVDVILLFDGNWTQGLGISQPVG